MRSEITQRRQTDAEAKAAARESAALDREAAFRAEVEQTRIDQQAKTARLMAMRLAKEAAEASE